MKPAERQRKQQAFLAAYAQTGIISAACQAAEVHRSTIYQWQEHDDAFAMAYRWAEADAHDVIRAAIYQRAIVGVDKPLFFQGQPILDPRGRPVTVKEYSDTLLAKMAVRLPEFRERQQVDVHATVDIQGAADDADRRWAALVATLTTRPVLGEPDAEGEG